MGEVEVQKEREMNLNRLTQGQPMRQPLASVPKICERLGGLGGFGLFFLTVVSLATFGMLFFNIFSNPLVALGLTILCCQLTLSLIAVPVMLLHVVRQLVALNNKGA